MTRRAALLLLPLALVSSGCGKKGPILPPLVRVPQPVQDVSLSRVGNRVILSWSNPKAYIDGNPVQGLSEVEVWVIEEATAAGAPAVKPAKGDFEKTGRLVLTIPAASPASPDDKNPPVPPASAVLEPDPGALAEK